MFQPFCNFVPRLDPSVSTWCCCTLNTIVLLVQKQCPDECARPYTIAVTRKFCLNPNNLKSFLRFFVLFPLEDDFPWLKQQYVDCMWHIQLLPGLNACKLFYSEQFTRLSYNPTSFVLPLGNRSPVVLMEFLLSSIFKVDVWITWIWFSTRQQFYATILVRLSIRFVHSVFRS